MKLTGHKAAMKNEQMFGFLAVYNDLNVHCFSTQILLFMAGPGPVSGRRCEWAISGSVVKYLYRFRTDLKQ